MIEIRGDFNKEGFTAEITKAVGSIEEVQSLTQRVTLEIRDFLTQEAEVQQALEKVLAKPGGRMS